MKAFIVGTLLSIALQLLGASLVGAQTPQGEFHVVVGRAFTVEIPALTYAEGYRIKFNGIQDGADILDADIVGGVAVFNRPQGFKTRGTYKLAGCAFGVLIDDATATEKPIERCTAGPTIIVAPGSLTKDPTVTFKLPPLTATTTTVSPSGSTTTTTAPK